jgi:hypothetical protein
MKSGYHIEYVNPLPVEFYPQKFEKGKSENLPALIAKARAYRAPEVVADYLNASTARKRTVNPVVRRLVEV